MRKPRFGKRRCPSCGDMVTKNALGYAAHRRACKGTRDQPRKTMTLGERADRHAAEAASLFQTAANSEIEADGENGDSTMGVNR